MKKLLLLSSLFVFLFAWSCNHHTHSKHEKEEISKDDKEIKHGNPDQAKLDSLKDAKTKGKQ